MENKVYAQLYTNEYKTNKNLMKNTYNHKYSRIKIGKLSSFFTVRFFAEGKKISRE